MFKLSKPRIVFSVIGLLTYVIVVNQLSAQQNSWMKLENMKTTRGKTSASSIGGKVYVIGSGQSVEEYDPTTNKWRFVKEMPISRKGSDACVIDGLLYVTGGQTASGLPGLVLLHSYNPATDVWKTDLDNMPVGQYILEASNCAGKIYAGFGLYHPNDLAEYEIVSNSWRKIRDTPSLECTALCGYNGILYAFGSAQGLKRVYAYNPRWNTWERRADMPTGRIGASAIYANGLIYVIGGTQDSTWPWDASQIKGTVEAYDPELDKWHTGYKSMLTPRYFAGACVIDSVIYVIGGKSSKGNCKIAEAFIPFPTHVQTKRDNLPFSFLLYQNYPNPFNPTTNIEFDLDRSCYVELKIYDLLGNEISSLVSSVLEQGNHSIKWDAENMPNGIYIYTLSDGQVTLQKKMTVLK